MENLEIIEIAESVKRTSQRVKNSGDIAFAKLGMNLSKKIIRQPTIMKAKDIEKEYIRLLKNKYLPNLPFDKQIATIASMAGYDDSSNTNTPVDSPPEIDKTQDSDVNTAVTTETNSPVDDGTIDVNIPNQPENDVISTINDGTPPEGTYITVVENLASNLSVPIQNNDTGNNPLDQGNVYTQVDIETGKNIANSALDMVKEYNDSITYSQSHTSNTADCSTYVVDVLNRNLGSDGYEIPYVTAQNTDIWIGKSPYFEKIEAQDARPGDVIVGHGGITPHMGIYQGYKDDKIMGTQMGNHGAKNLSWGANSAIPAQQLDFYRPIKPN